MAVNRRSSVNFLRLVESVPETKPVSSENVSRPAWQNTLFATEHPSLLVFVNFEFVSEADFLALLLNARPRIVVDLRLVPRFDVGGLNRRLVFSMFSQVSAQYFDLSGQLSVRDRRDANLNPALIVPNLQKSVFHTEKAPAGPICFIVDAQQFDENYIQQMAELIPSVGDSGWDVLRIPQSVIVGGKPVKVLERHRDLVFISHANPQDNAFALWLASRLACAGFATWSDVTRLLGGEEFWDSIEEAIRKHAAKVVVVLSQDAQVKKGVLDEINLAVSVERASSLDGFVIPVRVDNLPFDYVRANLARKKLIDFNGNWAAGLAQLLEVLERDGVPKVNMDGAKGVAHWHELYRQAEAKITATPETLVSNWLPITRLPDRIFMHDLNVENFRIDDVIKIIDEPCFRYGRLIGTFAEARELQAQLDPAIVVTKQYEIVLSDFRTGHPSDLPGLGEGEAHRYLVSLLRQAWNRSARARGLIPLQLASGGIAWFFPKGLVDGNKVVFRDYAGIDRRKTLVGLSKRRKVYWHFAVEAKPVLSQLSRLVLRPHVVFTEDGLTPLESKERMHALRRRFCKNWWNDRWRDLLLAFSAWFAGEAELIKLSVTGNAVELTNSLYSVSSPISIADDSVNESADETAELEGGSDELDYDRDDEESFSPDELHDAGTEGDPKVEDLSVK